MTALELFVAGWGIGAVFTWWRTTDITTDSPGLRFVFAMVAWPIFWIR